MTLSCLWPFLNLPFQLSGELWSVHSECEETLVLNAEMQTIFPLTRAGMPTVQCVQCRVQLYTTCWSCQLRMVPDPVKTWTTPLPTHSKCCLRHRPGTSGSAGVNLWWKCEEIIALWSLPVKIQNTPQKSYCGVIQSCNYQLFAPCDHKLWGEQKTMTCSC